jgi:hypothetical protein
LVRETEKSHGTSASPAIQDAGSLGQDLRTGFPKYEAGMLAIVRRTCTGSNKYMAY